MPNRLGSMFSAAPQWTPCPVGPSDWPPPRRALYRKDRTARPASEPRSSRRSAAYTPNFQKPGRLGVVKLPRRTIVQLLLLVLLPPVGLALLWRNARYPLRGQLLLSLLATLSLTCMLVFGFSRAPQEVIAPAPVAPAPAATATPEPTPTPSPEELAALAAAANPTPTPEPTPEPEPVYVYAVKRNASLYHSGKTCGKQKNSRKITLEEALEEGLKACPDCDPPTS